MDLHQLVTNAGEAESFLKLLANKNRLMILCCLIEKEYNVSELNARIPLGQSALSQHLASLRKHKVVTTTRKAQSIYYSISDQRVKTLIASLHKCFCE